jgi:hypothetical protein
MKTYTIIFALIICTLTGFGQSLKNGQDFVALDSLEMGPSYANDVYYSFENGVVASPARATWDIAFRTTVWTASIITNGGSGVNLYTYPNADTAGWNVVDTVGITGWPVLYDDEDDYEYGAFNRNSGAGHPDYGWGKYNPISHDVVGDSIYVLKSLSGLYYKIWILRKNSISNTYYIRYASLDGSVSKEVTLDINPYRAKNFVYFSMGSGELIDREPDTASWDILFTRYMAIQPNGTPYPVVGIYNNTKVYSNVFANVAPDFSDWTSAPLDSTKSPIGWDWKSFNMTTMTWTVADTNTYFVHTWDRDIYKLVFTKFGGSGSGKVVFESELLSPSSVINPAENRNTVGLHPNPAVDQVTLSFSDEINGKAYITVYDMTGKVVFEAEREVENHSALIRLNEAGLQNGLYVLKVSAGGVSYSSKFMISKF